ncbi:hypothetical protein Q4551_12335 [Oceanobacter sp. 5_MG-2023]|uniref:hypothetical protein n=1 Tax=Oceanobacter sp. 5_MG-2023 TaxID=3062645 RepID=UPI0026E12920|nr:hypothetical protein [Oceanobacter sp. 5_MG-2023]MDO6683078.1 hypothetical protein [Oceanobacter sp. 5_MG-2023]
MSKYEISTDEGVWQPGAEAGVLKNLRGLTLKDEIGNRAIEERLPFCCVSGKP